MAAIAAQLPQPAQPQAAAPATIDWTRLNAVTQRLQVLSMPESRSTLS
jgi:hypothetical protein